LIAEVRVAPACYRPTAPPTDAAYRRTQQPRSPARDALAPAAEEGGHEAVLRGRLDRERREGERHGERDVVTLGARGRGPTVRRMRLVHPHRRLDEPSELKVTAAGLELDAESEPRGTGGAARAR